MTTILLRRDIVKIQDKDGYSRHVILVLSPHLRAD